MTDLNQIFSNFLGFKVSFGSISKNQLAFEIHIKLLIRHAETKYKFSIFLNSLLQTSSLYTVCCCPTNCYTNKSGILNDIMVNGVALITLE